MACPVIGFSAYSGTGKTTVMERVIRVLTQKGLRVGVVMHDGHDFDIDHRIPSASGPIPRMHGMSNVIIQKRLSAN